MSRLSLKWVVWAAVGYAALVSASPAGAQYGKNDQQQRYQEEQRRRDEENRRRDEENGRRAEEQRRLEDQRRRDEENRRRAEEQRRRAEEQRRLEDQRRRDEENRRLEDQRRREEENRRRLEDQRRQDLQRNQQKASPAKNVPLQTAPTVTQLRNGNKAYDFSNVVHPPSYVTRDVKELPKAPRTGAAAANTREVRAKENLPPGSIQTHHLIPNQLATHPMAAAAAKSGYNIDNKNSDNKSNFKPMPTRPDLPQYTNSLVHSGPHPAYTADVKSIMDARWGTLQYNTRQEAIANGWSKATYDSVLSQRARDEMKRIENQQRDRIDKHDVPTKQMNGYKKLG